MALLITGATGHVGLTLVRLAVEAGIPVLAQYRSSLSPAVVERFGSAVTWVQINLADPFAIAALAAEHAIEGCVHSGAVPNEQLARPIPWETIQTNANGTAALLEVARRQRWRRFIYVSTGAVFQRETDFTRPILENHPISPMAIYGVTKAAGETWVSLYRRVYGVPASTIRISHVYGPPLVPVRRDIPRGPLVAFLREAILGLPIREGGGEFVASFTHVTDVAEGLLAAWRAPDLRHDVYHLGNGRNWTTYEAAEAVRNAVPGAVVEIGPGTEPWTSVNAMRGPLAGSRLHEDTGWSARLPLAEGAADFAAWMRAHPERMAG